MCIMHMHVIMRSAHVMHARVFCEKNQIADKKIFKPNNLLIFQNPENLPDKIRQNYRFLGFKRNKCSQKFFRFFRYS